MMTPEQALRTFDFFQNREDMLNGHLHGTACYHRAFHIGRHLIGHTSAADLIWLKAPFDSFLPRIPDIDPRQSGMTYHVAARCWFENDEALVFDTCLFDGPVTDEQWVESFFSPCENVQELDVLTSGLNVIPAYDAKGKFVLRPACFNEASGFAWDRMETTRAFSHSVPFQKIKSAWVAGLTP